MVRDLEIQRLVNYIKGIGLKVTFSSKRSDCDASWYLDNSGIVIYKAKKSSKIDIVLSLIHELGHALHNIHEKERKEDPKFLKALNHVDEAEEENKDSKKRQRKIILDNELAATRYWHSIYKETNMKFPLWKLEAAMEYDMWQYEFFYETGDYPMIKIRRPKLREILKKHRE